MKDAGKLRSMQFAFVLSKYDTGILHDDSDAMDVYAEYTDIIMDEIHKSNPEIVNPEWEYVSLIFGRVACEIDDFVQRNSEIMEPQMPKEYTIRQITKFAIKKYSRA